MGMKASDPATLTSKSPDPRQPNNNKGAVLAGRSYTRCSHAGIAAADDSAANSSSSSSLHSDTRISDVHALYIKQLCTHIRKTVAACTVTHSSHPTCTPYTYIHQLGHPSAGQQQPHQQMSVYISLFLPSCWSSAHLLHRQHLVCRCSA